MPRILIIYNSVLVVPLSMCSNIFRRADLQIYTKKNYSGGNKVEVIKVIKIAELPSESCGADDGSCCWGRGAGIGTAARWNMSWRRSL